MARFVALGLYLLVIGGAVALALNLFPDQIQASPDDSSHWPTGAVAAIPPGPLVVATTPIVEREPESAPEPVAPPSVWLPGVYAVVPDPVAPPAPPPADPPAAEASFKSTDGGGSGEGTDPAALPDVTTEATGEIGAGLYVSSDDATECSYALAAGAAGGGGSRRLVAEDALGQGRLLVTVEAGTADRFASSAGCGHWAVWAAAAEPLTEASNGDYWTGDLAAGDWNLPASCRWEEVSAFRGTQLDALTDSTAGPGQVPVSASTLGVRLRGCLTPATLSTPSADPAPPSPDPSTD